MDAVTPTAYANLPKWPPPLQPSVQEAPTITAASLYYLTGAGTLPQMPANWAGGADRWNQQMDFVQRAAQEAQRVEGVPSAAGPVSTSVPTVAAAPPSGHTGTIALVLLLLGAAGGGLWWWRRRRIAPWS